MFSCHFLMDSDPVDACCETLGGDRLVPAKQAGPSELFLVDRRRMQSVYICKP